MIHKHTEKIDLTRESIRRSLELKENASEKNEIFFY